MKENVFQFSLWGTVNKFFGLAKRKTIQHCCNFVLRLAPYKRLKKQKNNNVLNYIFRLRLRLLLAAEVNKQNVTQTKV